MTTQDLLDYPIDPVILEEEQIRLNRPILVVLVMSETDESNTKSVVESVASYNSIVYNADFIQIR